VVLALVGTAEALDVDVAPYRQAALAKDVGVVAGRVYEEPRKPSGPIQPLVGATAVLLPRSEAVLASLQRFKEDARASSKAFAAAAPAVRRTQEAYERELLTAGMPDLARRVATERDGSFRLAEVPAGAWIVLVWHSTPVDLSAPKARGREHHTFQLPGRTTGFQAVTIWLQEVTVARDETVSLELTDRNGWLRGVIEEKALGTGG
jgi:hypothetical protein